jgi:hypothetical protein
MTAEDQAETPCSRKTEADAAICGLSSSNHRHRIPQPQPLKAKRAEILPQQTLDRIPMPFLEHTSQGIGPL